MIAAVVIVVAMLVDRLFGEPPNALHPVAWMGTAIGRGRDWALPHRPAGQLVRGAIVALSIPTACALIAWCIARGSGKYGVIAVFVSVLALKPLFAMRALRDAAFVVRDAALAGDLPAARRGLQSLCSRDASALDEPSVIAATVESIAENASDSIVAPLFYFVCLGLPGAAFYRASNTLDAMIGYHGKYEWVGKTAARLDDVLNLAPARITTALFLIVTPLRMTRGAAIAWRDGATTESPNAGRPMAAMAGLLGVRLEKHGHYALGDAHRAIVADDITRAWSIVSRAAWAMAAVCCVISLALERSHG